MNFATIEKVQVTNTKMEKNRCPILLYLQKLLSLPLTVSLQKAGAKLTWLARQRVLGFFDRIRGTEISTVDLLKALGDRFKKEGISPYLRHRMTPYFFFDASQQNAIISEIDKKYPGIRSHTIAVARKTLDHTFNLLGSGPTRLGMEIDWHSDFKSRHRWGRRYHSLIRPASFPGGADIKVPWELSRCQHFIWLGQAYWFTRDEKYAQEFVSQLRHWISQNPPNFGVNWASTMDVAIRVVNWIWGYYLFKDSMSLSDDFHLAFLKSLLAHGRFIMNHLEVHKTPQGDLTTNHYLANIVGLVYLGILFPEFEEAQAWKEFGLGELEGEMFRQVYADGFHFESSSSYHRLVLEMYLSTVILARKNGESLSQSFMQRLEHMLDVILHLTKPDGTTPLIGDQDNGRLHRLKIWEDPQREWSDFRYMLAIGAALFQRADFAVAAGDQWEEAIWLLGTEVINLMKDADTPSSSRRVRESRGFQDAGVFVLRSEDIHIVIDAGGNGQAGFGGHAHNDILSFEMYAMGHTWMIDPGTYVYTSSYEDRNIFRSTAYHNTIRVDREELNRIDPYDLFRLLDEAPIRINQWTPGNADDLLDAEHGAYCRLKDAVTHRRQMLLDKQAGTFLIKDSILGQEKHWIESFFHIGTEDFTITTLDQLSVQITHPDGGALYVIPLIQEGLELVISDGWVSKSYGHRETAPVLSYRKQAKTPTALVTLFSFHQASEEVNVHQLRNIGEQALADLEERIHEWEGR